MTTKPDRLSLDVVVLDDSQYNQARGISIIFPLAIAAAGIASAIFALVMQTYGILLVAIFLTLAGLGAGHTSFTLTLCKMLGTEKKVTVGADGVWLYGSPRIGLSDIKEIDCSYSLWLTELEMKDGDSLFLACPGRESGPHFARYLEFRSVLTNIHTATTNPAGGA